MAAVKANNRDLVELLLSYKECQVNELNAGGTGALAMACRMGHGQIVDLLLQDERTDINCLGRYGGTPLHNAAGFGHGNIVRRLLDHGAQIQASYTDQKLSPIDVARSNGHQTCLEQLEQGAKNNATVAKRAP